MKKKGWLNTERNIKCGITKPVCKKGLFDVLYFSQKPQKDFFRLIYNIYFF